MTSSSQPSPCAGGMSDQAEVLVDDADGVRTITLNRADRLNALVDSMMSALADAAADAARDPAVGCVVVTGAGRGFCAGGDVKAAVAPLVVNSALGGRAEQAHVTLRSQMETVRLLHEMPKPTIAMINGPAAGAGIGIAGACDLRFAAESATFSSAFDKIGGSGDFGATWFWTKILGAGKARELFFLSEKYTAQQALAQGLFTRVFADAALREETMNVARRMAHGPRMGWRYMKANLNYAQDGHFETALDREALHMGLSTYATALILKARKETGQD
jgi:2-(1,2-epoxy-1,2-dihydrophenyl)acetyl-CoA isomerase